MPQFVVIGDTAINLSLVKYVQRYRVAGGEYGVSLYMMDSSSEIFKGEQARKLWYHVAHVIQTERIP